ncbi:MAG: YybH family protein [Pyrinomonadaceae bacterium]
MKKIIFVCLLILYGASFSFAQSKADEKIKTEIRAVMDAQVSAWNAGSIDGFMQGYRNSPELTFVSGTNVTKGWQPTLDRYKKSYDSKAKMGVLTFSDLEITVLSKDAAVVLGSWALQRDADNPHGKFTLTFRKFKDGWKIIIDHTS